jgi:hypoxanthine phosphoribosyltransferase
MSPEKIPCEYMRWERFYDLSVNTGKKIIHDGYVPDVIVSLARGGWCFARVLCDVIGVKDLLSVKVEHWGVTATPDGEARIKYPLNVGFAGKRVLVVDDISDTGKSLRVATDHVWSFNPLEVKTATLLLLKGSTFAPDFFGEELTWRWVVFPWNFVEDMCNLIPKVLEDGISVWMIKQRMKEIYSLDLTEEEITMMLSEVERRKH